MKKSAILTRFFPICLLLCFAWPETVPAQASTELEKAEKKVEKAREDFEKAKKAVEDEIARLKKESENDPKAHGPAPELEKLRKALKKAEEALEKAKDALKKAAEAAVKKAQRALNREKSKRPPDKQKLEDAEKALKEAEEKLKEVQGATTLIPGDGAKAGSDSYCFTATLTGAVPLADPGAVAVDFAVLQAALFAPPAMEQLFEALGGEYSVGDLSGSKPVQAFEMAGRASFAPGLSLGVELSKRLELHGGVQYFKASWEGSFPVTVFPFGDVPPYVTPGVLRASAKGMTAQAELVFYLSRGTVRPYVKAGIQGWIPFESKSGLRLAGEDFPLEMKPLHGSFSPCGGAGVRVMCWKRGFATVGATYAKLAGDAFGPMLEFGLGWRLGGGIE